MSKLLFLSLSLLAFSTYTYAGTNVDLFAIDQNEVSEKFSTLTEIEVVVVEEQLDLEELEVSHAGLLSSPSFTLSSRLSVMSVLATMDDPPLGIPSFLWGMCLGLPGLAVVYFITEDDEETKKALWGCIASIAVYTVLWLLYAVLVGASFWGWYI